MKRILVIGGGVAGLTAARELAQSGARVTLLEARSRLGGRIHTEYPRGAGGPVELGAEFLHGRHPELWRMARAAGLLVYEVRGEHRYARPGRLEAGEGIWDRTGQILSRMARAGGPDRTFAEFIHGEFAGPRWKEAREWAINYVEGFNAADHERVSIQWLAQGGRASGEIEGDRQFRAANGYSRLIDWLVGECERLGVIIVPGSAVRRIVWRRGSLSASTNSDPGPAPRFDAAIVTVPLGVLQAGDIRFEPDPPNLAAARQLVMGPVARVTLRCKEAFWEEGLPAAGGAKVAELSFIHARDELFPTWWTQYPLQSRLITAWAGGPRAARLLALSDSGRTGAAVDSLARATGLKRNEVETSVEGVHHHDWASDPFARGAYCYVPAGATGAVRELAAPCEETLFFAGEAADTTGHTGTVHGAIASGLRAAAEAMGSRSPTGELRAESEKTGTNPG